MLFITAIATLMLYGFAQRKMQPKPLRGACIAALLLYLFVLFYITMFSRQAVLEVRWNLTPLRNFDFGMFFGQLLPNILFFIPVGILLVGILQSRSFILPILLGIGLSVCIELIQLFVHVGICDVDDLLANSIGVVLGAVPAQVLPLFAKRTKPDA